MRTALLPIGGVLLGLMACSAGDEPACQDPRLCAGDPGAGCRWACVDGACQPLCSPECTLDADCAGLAWSETCVGHWACQAGACRPVCDGPACSQDGDCQAPLPCEHGGAWRCEAGECVPDCDPPPSCAVAADCLGRPWPAECEGRWTCVEAACEPVCDPVTCPDGACDGAAGEDAATCPYDCGARPCGSFADCLDLPWPLGCLGAWVCQGGACVARCNSACVGEGLVTGAADGCCAGLQPLVDCPPGEGCDGTRLFCVDCRDGVCDPHESSFNCTADCPAGCPAGEQRAYTCPGGESVPWCECREPACRPRCQAEAAGQEAWVDSCTQQVLLVGACRECTPVCGAIGTREEGWYEECDNTPSSRLITYAFCAPRWSCPQEPVCGG